MITKEILRKGCNVFILAGKVFEKCCLFFFVALICLDASPLEAATLIRVSDTIARSSVAAATRHTLRFRPATAIPASGAIVITPASGSFTIPSNLDVEDIGLLINGVTKILGATPGSSAGSRIGVAVASGTAGRIVFTLNDADPVPAQASIVITIGTGNRSITNPGTAGSYRIRVQTKNAAGAVLDSADAMVAIVAAVVVNAVRATLPAPATALAPAPAPVAGGLAAPSVSTLLTPPPPALASKGSAGFFGIGYPHLAVTLLKDAQIAATTTAKADSSFRLQVDGLSDGDYLFSVYSEDRDGRRSTLQTFFAQIKSGGNFVLNNIFITPTLATDLREVRSGERISLFGQSAQLADMVIALESEKKAATVTAKADRDGVYFFLLDTDQLPPGRYTAKAKALAQRRESQWSQAIEFTVGEKSVLVKPPAEIAKVDITKDGKIDITDFSVLAFWYKKPLTAEAKKTVDFNKDGKVSLVDFSILAFYWTG